MDSRKIKREIKISEWTEIIRKRNESGLTVRAWCEQTGISEDQYYYWLRVVRASACRALDTGVTSPVVTDATGSIPFARLDVSPMQAYRGEGISIRCGNTDIHISPESNSEHVHMVLEAMIHA